MTKTEKRAFTVHPGIIKHLIKEQAGTVVKAVAELIMNSVDAGATRIDMEFREDGTFTIKDNGRGFRGRSEIENFFETFGTPHVDGDAHYGRFRIGRGQIMAYANTVWRSGNFVMDVRLLDADADFGYTLTETTETHVGCQIDGVITDENLIRQVRHHGLMNDEDRWFYGDDGDFSSNVRFVAVPIYLSGELINTSPSSQKWSYEDEYGYYLFDKSYVLKIYNQGVYVATEDRRKFSVGGIFVSKKPLKLNMARNAWIEHECEVIRNLRSVARAEYIKSIENSKRISDDEIGAIVSRIALQNEEICENEAFLLFKTRFIPVLGGGRVSPGDFLEATNFSLYDGRSSLIGERAISEGGIGLLMPVMFGLARLKQNEQTANKVLGLMCRLFRHWIANNGRYFISFDQIVESYSGTFKETADSELSPKKLAALNAVRYVGSKLKRLANDPSRRMRKFVAGKSDCASAWTNGFDYIAFDESALEQAYLTEGSGGIERLVNLAIHEFCHQAESSVESHEHTLAFYTMYHNATLSPDYGEAVRACYRRYLDLLLRGGNKLSSKERKHLSSLRGTADEMDSKFPVRKRGSTGKTTPS